MTNTARRSSALTTIVLALFLVVSVVPGAAASLSADAQTLVRTLADKAIATLRDKSLPPEQQARQVRTLFTRYFAVPEIGRWVLGRYWRVATEAERQQYLKEFEDYIVYSYTKRFRDYAGQELKVVNALVDKENSATVFSELTDPARKDKTEVLWRVGRQSQGMKVTDVVVEGVSMRQTQRADFTAAVKHYGGRVSGLIDALHKKNQTLKADLGLAG